MTPCARIKLGIILSAWAFPIGLLAGFAITWGLFTREGWKQW